MMFSGVMGVFAGTAWESPAMAGEAAAQRNSKNAAQEMLERIFMGPFSSGAAGGRIRRARRRNYHHPRRAGKVFSESLLWVSCCDESYCLSSSYFGRGCRGAVFAGAGAKTAFAAGGSEPMRERNVTTVQICCLVIMFFQPGMPIQRTPCNVM